MKTIITGFHQDKNKEWVADLSCGHTRHLRYNSPFHIREWVTSPQSRNTYIGLELECRLLSYKVLDWLSYENKKNSSGDSLGFNWFGN